jgi:penicillin amidase
VVSTLEHPTNEMFGDSAGSGRDRMLRETLQTAAEKLAKLQGSDSRKWSWGKLHVMRFRHSLDQTQGASAVMDQGPVERPGDDYTVNSTESGENFEQAGGASYREILDTSDWDRSVGVNTPGQSGQPGSPHYGDLIPLWDQGKYFPLFYSQAAVEKAAKQTLVLEP